jgi:hypothetical protein
VQRRTATAALVSLALAASAGGRPVLQTSVPLEAPEHRPLVIEGTLVDGDAVRQVVIRYRAPAEDYEEVPMALQYGDLYRGAIPAHRMLAPGVELYVEGLLTSGERVALYSSAKTPARVFVGARPDGGPAR